MSYEKEQRDQRKIDGMKRAAIARKIAAVDNPTHFINWYDDVPEPELMFASDVRLEVSIIVDRLADESVLKAATSKLLKAKIAEKYGLHTNYFHVLMHRMVKWGWIKRPFRGGYRVTDKAISEMKRLVGEW